jgi:hypothetical protein
MFPDTIKSCNGIILNTPEAIDYGKCPLHRFRFGKNPNPKLKTSKGRFENLSPFKKHVGV